MTLTKRISELLQSLSVGIPEREFFIQLGFLSTLIGEPFYLYGRAGSGKSLIIERLIAAFKNAKVLKIGKRDQEIPEKLNAFDIIVFQKFDPADEDEKTRVHIALQDSDKASVIISGELRPEVALNRGEIVDEITLTIALPDSISSGALCSLLQTPGDVTATHVPLGMAVSAEERNLWNEEIKKVSLSADSLNVIGKVAEICEQNNFYVSIRKWIALTNMVKAVAFFNGRSETQLTDTFFLGTSIWGRNTSNKIIADKYREIVYSTLFKDAPGVLNNPYDGDQLLERVHKLLNRSNNLYETKNFNNEPCLFYRITIAGEPTPLYAPLRYVETEQDFHPYNELRQEEKRVLCNYHGTSSCSIAIDASIKSVGLRNSTARSASAVIGKYEDFANVPSYIVRENDSTIIAQKQEELDAIRKEIQEVSERESKNLLALRDVYKNIKTAQEDLFCNKVFFEEAQAMVKKSFDASTTAINKLKEAHELIASKSI